MDQPKQPSILESMTNARDYWYGRAIALEHELETLKKPHAEPYKEGYMLLLADHTSLQARITELEAQLAQTPTIPPDVRETLRETIQRERDSLARHTNERKQYYAIYKRWPDGDDSLVTRWTDKLSRYDAALAWLDAQGGTP